MSKALKTVAVIAGAVALVATGVGAFAAPALAATASTVASIATAVSGVASLAAQLTAKTPPARGTPNSVIIASDSPSPYVIGRTFTGGVLRHDRGYGATYKKVPNPYRAMALVLSVAGPVQAVEATCFDYSQIPFSGSAATGYYAGFLYRDVRLGLNAESALTPQWAGLPGWSTSHRLSSKCAVMLSMMFDKDGKRFASGVPSIGHIVRGVKVYDPRKDSGYPGGSGAHRIDNEATWEYSENPGLHGLTYALGRYRNGKKVFGIGLPPAGIRITDFVACANVCDANGWKVGGVIYEPGSDNIRWRNLKEILQAGGAVPGFPGGKLGLKINAPGVSLYTVTKNDLADDDAEITAMQTGEARLNGIIPKYRSEANQWAYVPSDKVSIATYVTEDGEEKTEERQYNLVQSKDQAAQLAAYDLVNGREMYPITKTFKPHMREFSLGNMLTLDLPDDHGLAGQKVVIVDRTVDPGTMKVTFTFVSETDAKHDFALGRTGIAPPTPSLTSPQDRDETIYWVDAPRYEDGTFVDDLRPAEPGATVGATPAERDLIADLDAASQAGQDAIALVDARLDILESTIGGGGVDLSEIISRILAAEGDIEEVNTTLVAQDARITNAQTVADTAAGTLSTLTTDVEAAGAKATSAMQAVDILTGQQATISDTAETARSWASDALTATSTLSGDVATIRSQARAGSPNLLRFGGFEAGATGWTLTSGMTPRRDPVWGSVAHSFVSATGAPIIAAVSDFVAVTAGQTYTLAGDLLLFASSTVADAYLDRLYYDAAGAQVPGGDGGQRPIAASVDFANDPAKRDAVALAETVPAGATQCRVRLVVNPNGATVTAFGMREVKLEQGSAWTRFSGEASSASAFTALSDLTTQFAQVTIDADTANTNAGIALDAIESFEGDISLLYARAAIGVTVGVDGVSRWTGMEINGTTVGGGVNIHADLFRVTKPGTGQHTEYSDGNWRAYDSTGQIRSQWGVWA